MCVLWQIIGDHDTTLLANDRTINEFKQQKEEG